MHFLLLGLRLGGRARPHARIDVPTWAEIGDNYPSRVADTARGADGAAFLSRAQRPACSSGTGSREPARRTALRALAWDWRAWCGFHYITDPETFFGPARSTCSTSCSTTDEATSEWRLLILEDTGELLAADAKEQSGSGPLAAPERGRRTDRPGAAGARARDDERELRRLHPAVRAGAVRLAHRVRRFPRGTRRELGSRGTGRAGRLASRTLAALYARLEAGVVPPAARQERLRLVGSRVK